MTKIWTRDNFGSNLQISVFIGRVFGVLLFLLLGIIGCAMLQEAPLVEIPASHLTCDQNPQMVDGNLETVGTFAAHGSIKKEFVTRKANRVYQPQQYQRRVEGLPQNRNTD